MKASAFRRWPVAGAYSPEQTTRLTGGSDWAKSILKIPKKHLLEEEFLAILCWHVYCDTRICVL